jgi:uncharacterized protein (DUF1330 family)
MVAYVVGEVFVTDDAFAEEYRPKVRKLIEKHGGKFISDGTFEKLEGARENPDWLVLIEFPTSELAKAWYNDPEYAPVIELRDTGSRSEIMLVGGIE